MQIQLDPPGQPQPPWASAPCAPFAVRVANHIGTAFRVARRRFHSLAHAARQAGDRLLHPFRRRAALEALRNRRITSVMVVCQGNICRSPFAAGRLRVALGKTVRVGSAGLIGPGRQLPPEALAAARALGTDLSAHRSRLLTPKLVRAADLVVVMDPAQQALIRDRFGRPPHDVLVLGDLDPRAVQTRAIPDPIDQPIEQFESCYARIDRCARELARAIKQGAMSVV